MLEVDFVENNGTQMYCETKTKTKVEMVPCFVTSTMAEVDWTKSKFSIYLVVFF